MKELKQKNSQNKLRQQKKRKKRLKFAIIEKNYANIYC